MKVSIGSDHRGIEQRKIIAGAVAAAGHEPIDCGTESTDSVDYPDIAGFVAKTVVSGESEAGILICGTGIGMSIAANKVKGIRAAVVCNPEAAALARSHNNANIICVAGSGFSADGYTKLIAAWLSAEFEGGRHARRVEKISAMES